MDHDVIDVCFWDLWSVLLHTGRSLVELYILGTLRESLSSLLSKRILLHSSNTSPGTITKPQPTVAPKCSSSIVLTVRIGRTEKQNNNIKNEVQSPFPRRGSSRRNDDLRCVCCDSTQPTSGACVRACVLRGRNIWSCAAPRCLCVCVCVSLPPPFLCQRRVCFVCVDKREILVVWK
jgi:hypothetical protein